MLAARVAVRHAQLLREVASRAMTSPTIYRSSTLPGRRHPLRSTRLNPHPLTHSPQGGSTAVPRFTDDSVHALRHAVATQRDAIALMGSEKSPGATCPSSVLPRFYSKGQETGSEYIYNYKLYNYKL